MAFFSPLQDMVAPATESTSVDWAAIMAGMKSRSTASKIMAVSLWLSTVMAVMFPPSTVMVSAMGPLRPAPSTWYTPSV